MRSYFSRELAEILEGPPKISQTELANKAKLTKSKLSRLLSDVIACDRPTLENILAALPQKESKSRVASAYMQDVAGPQALATLKADGDPFGELDMSKLSRKGKDALKKLLHSPHHEDLERIAIDLVIAFGL